MIPTYFLIQPVQFNYFLYEILYENPQTILSTLETQLYYPTHQSSTHSIYEYCHPDLYNIQVLPKVLPPWLIQYTTIATLTYTIYKYCHLDLYNIQYTVRKMGLILRSIERMLKMQFSMARRFTLQPLRRYDVKPPKKTAQAYCNLPFDMQCYEKTIQHRLDSIQRSLDPQSETLPLRHAYTCEISNNLNKNKYILLFFWNCVIFRINESKAKTFWLSINLLLI